MNIPKHETHTSKKREMFHEVLKAWTQFWQEQHLVNIPPNVGPNKNYIVL
jgi:hypothetical protein